MASRGARSDAELIGALDDLAQHLVELDASALRAAVGARLRDEQRSLRRDRWPRVRVRTRVLVGAALTVLAVSAVLALSSSTREAVADFLGLRGVLIEHRGSAPNRVGSTLSLGTRVRLDEARRRVDFPIAIPAHLGTPDAVYLSEVPTGGRVTLAYAPQPNLPATDKDGVALLVTEFHADIHEPVIRKTLTPANNLDRVTVGGAAGYWISGEPHVLTLADANGRFFTHRARLAGNTLLWQRGSVTYRLESALSRNDALRIAESLRTGA